MNTCTDVYQYTEDRYQPRPGSSAGELGVCSPLNPELWEAILTKHPDKRFVDYLLEGVSDGFRISFSHSELGRDRFSSAKQNMRIVLDNAPLEHSQ